METSRGNRTHIAIFGKRNVGKSSLINVLTDQEVATVSDVLGTTTDPVYKSMELLPLGPVVLIDTAGLDDDGELGQKRVDQTKKIIHKADIALYMFDVNEGIDKVDLDTIDMLTKRETPVIALFNKVDTSEMTEESLEEKAKSLKIPHVLISAKNNEGIDELKTMLATIFTQLESPRFLIGDLVSTGDVVVLVTPIDEGAPKGRLILPQQQTIRELLEHGAISIVTREVELAQTLEKFGDQVKLVVTDAQAFGFVAKIVPPQIPLTSFSILFARFKGELEVVVEGIKEIEHLKAGAKVLICEACTHHRQGVDIGKVKIPQLLRQMTNVDLDFTWYSGTGFPTESEIAHYDFMVHCGGCMINQKEMEHRLNQAKQFNIPVVNYGIFLAYASGVLKRAIEPFEEISSILEEGDHHDLLR